MSICWSLNGSRCRGVHADAAFTEVDAQCPPTYSQIAASESWIGLKSVNLRYRSHRAAQTSSEFHHLASIDVALHDHMEAYTSYRAHPPSTDHFPSNGLNLRFSWFSRDRLYDKRSPPGSWIILSKPMISWSIANAGRLHLYAKVLHALAVPLFADKIN
jgi:hypothetical protein